MKAGIVFKIDGPKAIVLKADGSFVSVTAKAGWRVGETVPLSTASRRFPMRSLATAACLAILFIGGFGWNRLYISPVALISLDVNPSIELQVNRFKRITSATALNDEGARILAQADVKNAACKTALINILNAEETSGYLTADTNVVLTVFASDSSVQAALLSELQNAVDAGISHYSDPVNAEYHCVDENTVHGAHAHGVTAGKYLYLQTLQELDPETDISQLSHHSIEQIKGKIASCQQGHDANRVDSHHSGGHGH